MRTPTHTHWIINSGLSWKVKCMFCMLVRLHNMIMLDVFALPRKKKKRPVAYLTAHIFCHHVPSKCPYDFLRGTGRTCILSFRILAWITAHTNKCMHTQNQLMTVALQYWLMLLLVLHFLEFCAVHKQLQLTETEYLIKNRDKTTDGILVEMEGSHAEKNSMSCR